MSPPALPRKAAIVGLSSSAATSWASRAHLPGILNETGRSKIAIRALLNSSIDAAKRAVSAYNLPAETKTYGSPQDLADDAEIDLVICNTRVDVHYETIIASVRAGKDVYVEWPIAAKQEHIAELLETSGRTGSRIAVGLQRRWVPPIVKLREFLSSGSGQLGKVLSSNVHAFGGTVDREILPTTLKYFAQREIGGNPIIIGFGHLFDYVLSVVGELEPATVQSKVQLQRPTVRVRDTFTNEVVETITSDVPDLLALQGSIIASKVAAPNATLSMFFRRGQPFPGTPSLSWTINCEHGEIRLVSPSGLSLETLDNEEPVLIQVHRYANNEVEEIPFDWSQRQKELHASARSVSECLYAFADGRPEGDGWAGIESAAKRASMIERFLSAA